MKKILRVIPKKKRKKIAYTQVKTTTIAKIKKNTFFMYCKFLSFDFVSIDCRIIHCLISIVIYDFEEFI